MNTNFRIVRFIQRYLVLLTGLLFFHVAGIACFAQNSSSNTDVSGATNTGIPTNGIFSGSNIDNIQINNGNLHIEIPLITLEGRGDVVTYKYVYNSKGWEFELFTDLPPNIHKGFITPEANNTLQFAFLGGESFGYNVSYKTSEQQCSSNQGQPIIGTTYSAYTLIEPDGTKHPFPGNYGPVGDQCPAISVGPLYSSDGSGWIMHVGLHQGLDLWPVDAIRKDGTKVKFDSGGGGTQVSATDRNGNVLSETTDTLGRSTPVETPSGATLGSEIDYFDSNGNTQKIQVTRMQVPVQTSLCSFQTIACQEDQDTFTPPQTISLANGLTYQFQYAQNQYGQPSSMTLPGGAKISWTWGNTDSGGPQVTARTVTVGGQSFTWTYSYGTPSISQTWVNSIIDPLGNETDYTCQYKHVGAAGPAPYSCTIIKTEYFQGLASPSNLLKTVVIDYQTSGAILPVIVTTTWNQQNLVSKVETDWDSGPPIINAAGQPFRWSNPLERREFGYGMGAPGSMSRRTHYDYLHLNDQAYRDLNLADLQSTTTIYDGSGNLIAQTSNAYDGSSLVSTSGVISHDYTNFSTTNTKRGNLSQVSRWRNTDGAWIHTNHAYNDLGNLVSTTDPNGNITNFNYDDNWANSGCVPTGGVTQSYVTQVTNALGQKTKHTYYPCTGLIQAAVDQNGAKTIFTYDLMSRPLIASRPDGGQTSFDYHGDALPLKTTKTVLATPDPSIVETYVYDGLGRISQTQLTSDPSGTDFVDTTYDALGRVATVSNPHRSNLNLTDGVTSTSYDALGRVKQITKQDGSISSISYSGNCITTSDEALNKRQLCSDSLGRLTSVFEDPSGLNYETDYQYDVLGNLLRVDQKGSAPSDSTQWRTRLFSYNSLSQLIAANNPESGTICYGTFSNGNCVSGYDANGNILAKTDARGITTNYSYDALNRLTQKIFSNGDASELFYYDSYPGWAGGASSGRLVKTDRNGGHYFQYDAMGRVTATWQCLPSDCNAGASTGATYNLAGNLTQLTYPDFEQINYTHDGAGRPLSVLDAVNSINYVTGAKYAPNHALTDSVYGKATGFSGIVNSFSYNSRLQPATIWSSSPIRLLMYLVYDFHEKNGDNGSVWGITNNRDTTRSQSFTYDALNRLTSGQNSGTDCGVPVLGGATKFWGNKYLYDAWGNLKQKTVNKCSAENLSVSLNTNNRFDGYGYDAAGNMTHDITGNHNYSFDAESQIAKIDNGAATYTYDAEGHRLRKDVSGSSSTEYIYFNTDVIAEKNVSTGGWTNYVFLNGQRIARHDPSGAVSYYFSDHLKTASVITDVSGTIQSESDYYPWGGELKFLNNDPNHYKFTGKERDSESGNDYFEARYYSSAMGRFLIPDWSVKIEPVPYAKLDNPQSLNLYSYVLNSPLSNLDTDGHACEALYLNIFSGFCTRASEYGRIDAIPGVKSKTRFFAAANAVSQALADVATPVSSLFVSSKTAAFLEGLGQNLERLNRTEASSIQQGSLSGPDLDQRLVHNEQSAVQDQLNSLRQSDPSGYSKIIGEVNGALNGLLTQALEQLSSTDRAYAGVLADVRKQLGRDIDFSRQSDREAIGNALIKHVRQTGGCDLNGSKQAGCK
jgi:RHS repeat-associated protein